MNFLDPYDITNASSNTPPPPAEQSLNEEVSQVLGQFNKFWGGFRQQSQAALQIARKDFGDVVQQAQKELSRLTTETTPATSSSDGARDSSATPTASQPEAGPSGTSSAEASTETPTTATAGASTSPAPAPGASASTTVQNLFSRLQSAIPPNVVSTVQNNLPTSLRHPESIDFSQLRSTLATEFERVQGVTRAQAEEYVHRSEEFLREAAREAEEILRDAVKVIPPEEQTSSQDAGLIWDGSDMWMLPGEPSEGDKKGKGKDKAQSAVATRAEALLRRLKTDPEILKHDPQKDGVVHALYEEWVKTEVEAKEGGVEGKEWKAKVETALKPAAVDRDALQATHDKLVPSELSEEVFWKRFFFRVHQIESEEAKRKALIQGSVDDDDDLTWDDEEEDEVPTSMSSKTLQTKSSTTTLQASKSKDDAKHLSAPSSGHASPRQSSEESYDVVSTTSGNTSAAGESTAKVGDKKTTESDEGDSDWE